jgi:hypothetical protein
VVSVETRVEEVSGVDPTSIPSDILDSSKPLVLRGLVAGWPIVEAGRQHSHRALDQIRSYYRSKPVALFLGDPEINGRFFYNDDLTGFNFNHMQSDLGPVLDKLIAIEAEPDAMSLYVGSTAVDAAMPGFREHNDLGLTEQNPLVSIWLGNRSRIAAHFDYPQNIACCVLGRRRFTLFPPEQLSNLYLGPLELTPAGQQISLVDLHDPDFDRYPKFAEALNAASMAELEPGDALFLPSLWWHHVEALEPINVLINYWWNPLPDYLGYPADALTHAMFSIKELPREQRQAWRAYFDYYVFGESDDRLAHIPEKVRGRLDRIDEVGARRLRAELLNKLKQ